MESRSEKAAHTGTVEVKHDIYTGDRTDQTRNSDTRVRRLFSSAQIFFFALSYMSSWEAIATNVGLAFYNGGPRALVWGFFIVVPGVLCQVASLAEMASIQPIAGAQYHWCHALAPRKYARFITWIQGWITWFSWISLLASTINICANVTLTIAVAAYPSYTSQAWHTVLLMYGYIIFLALLNAYAFRFVPWIELLSGVLHIILWIVFAAVFLGMAPKHDANFVFFEKAMLSGWNSEFVSFNLGTILVTWAFVGFDGSIHLSEEVRQARHAVPRALFSSIVINAVLAFAMLLIFLFCLGDTENLISSLYPLMAIALSATRSLPGSIALVVCILLTVILVTIGSVASIGRLTWAWSRDGALPAYFSHIDTKHRVPIRALWLPVLVVMLLSLLNLANPVAFSVIIALSTFGLYQSYFLAIACILYARSSGKLDSATWGLGRAGMPVNVFALIYTAWIGTFLVFPSYLPVTASTMNYALPINALVWIFAIALWFGWAKKNWKGVNEQVVELVVADSDRATKD